MIAMFCCSYGALADDSAQPQISIALTPAIITGGFTTFAGVSSDLTHSDVYDDI